MKRPRLPDADRLTLKTELRALVASVGGLATAARHTGLTEMSLSRFQSAQHDDLPGVETVALLERAAGAPLATQFLASHAAFSCAAAPTQTDCADLAHEAGEAIAAAITACAAPLTPARAEAAAKEVSDLIRAAKSLQRKLRAQMRAEPRASARSA